MKRSLILVTLLLAAWLADAQVTPGYYLPDDVTYNKSITTPSHFAGYEIGEWHLTHDKLYFYMLELARISDRAIWEEYGRSHENRPLGHLIISSPENIKNIEIIRQEHLKLSDPSLSGNYDTGKMPLFVKLGYGIHGNESSAQQASVLTAYYLLAGEGKKIDELLNNTVILIDPSLNPDGMQRHSTWVNMTKSLNNNPDPNSWEFSEPWPGGRTNHYWFDLNRDYIMLQHPESVGRVASFYKWRPNIITDHHEMGANSTFFFQPGVQSRNNPLTPADNQHLTAEIGKYHEKYLNSIGSLYYTEESFDDFYVGKGSSYPDIHGSVGILFEQAGVKGHIRETPGGLLSFPFAIRNQFIVSLSTLEAGLMMRAKLLESQRMFYKEALTLAEKHPVKAYVFTEQADKKRLSEFIRNLTQHQIKVYKLSGDFKKEGVNYNASDSYIVPLKQNEYRFIRSLFEPVTNFNDSLFYDVSTWVLPMSFNIRYTEINAVKELDRIIGDEITSYSAPGGMITGVKKPYAYLFEWNEYLAPGALYELQAAGIITRVSTDKFVYDDGTTKKEFSYGTIMVHVAGQSIPENELQNIMKSVAKDYGITVYGVSTGLTPSGIDLGSNLFSVVNRPSVMMFTGDGSSSGDAGEIWHMLDTRFKIPVTLVSPARANSINLESYNVIIVTGSPALTPSFIERIKEWNRQGGTIIGYKGANRWLSNNKIAEIDYVPAAEPKKGSGIYANQSADRLASQIPGSIFKTKLDLSHPLCYGYTSEILPVFKSGTTAVRKDPNIYNNPVTYTSDPLLSGYCTRENAQRIKETSFASVHGSRVISIYDNTNFRAIWYGTSKIFMNAIFFGQIL